MKRFVIQVLKKGVIFFTILLALAFGMEYVIYKNTKNNQYLLQGDWHIKRVKKTDILFIGNSRTCVHVDVKTINELTGLNTYCLAQNGRGAKELWYKFLKFVEYNGKPKTIYLQFDQSFLMIRGLTDNGFYGKENYLSYLYFDNLKINHVFEDNIGFHQYETFVPLVRYVGYSYLLQEHLSGEPNAASQYIIPDFKYGSHLQDIKWATKKEWKAIWNKPGKLTYPINTAYVDSFVNYCSENSIQLILVYPPQSYTSYKAADKKILDQLTVFAETRKVEFLNFNSEIYNDSTLFFNHLHLNRKGAEIYSRQLINHIDSLNRK